MTGGPTTEQGRAKRGVRTGRLSTLMQVGRLARKEVGLDVFQREILRVVTESLQADRATLYLIDADRQVLWSRTFTEAEVPEIRLELGRGIAGRVAASGQVINVPDARSDPRFDPSTDRRTGYETRSLVAAPLTDKSGRVIGVLQVLNKQGAPFFDAEDEDLLMIIATQLAMILSASSLGRRLVPQSRRLATDPVKRPRASERFNKVIGGSEVMAVVYDRIEDVARTDVTVLITGESGTGKELVSRAIHVNSDRRELPFVKVDCAALPENLLENELFGHERGAYTGATNRFRGKIEQAAGGTLFLDEIGELPLGVQGKLLRVLQDREFEPLGGSRTLKVRARIIAATNRDLTEMVAKKRFREDLYYRIRVAVIPLPPLRDRGPEDVRELAGYFIDNMARRHGKDIDDIDPELDRLLVSYPWPGNVRELEHCLESAVVFCNSRVLGPEHVALPNIRSPEPGRASAAGPSIFELGLSLKELERRYIEHVLAKVDGNKSEAARRLGIGRNTLGRKLDKYRED